MCTTCYDRVNGELHVQMASRAAENKIIHSHLSEMLPWVRQLSTLSDEDVATIYLMALGYRNIMKRTMGFDLFKTEESIDRHKMLAVQLGAQISDAQKSSLVTTANGLKVWLFTIRSVMHSELRPVGLGMWRQLARGFPHVHMIAEKTRQETGFQSDLTDCGMVPVGFEPTRTQ